jgi:hypothetical protein
VLYAFRLGPFNSEEGTLHAFVGITEVGMVPAVWERDIEKGLRGLKAHVWGEELVCEPGLSRVGKGLGFRGMRAPAWVLEPRAQLAASLLFAPNLAHDDVDAYVELVQAAARFAEQAPWRHFADEQPLDVRVWGIVDRRYEGCIMGNAGITLGLALYEQEGAVRRVSEHLDHDRPDLAAREDFLVVTLDGGPSFAARAMRDAYRIEAVPLPIAHRGGERLFASRTEMLALSAALRAASELGPGHLDVAIDGEAHEGEHVGARIIAPAIWPTMLRR